MTPDEFLDWVERQDLAYELVDGRPVLRDPVLDPADPARMMTGASRAHRRIVVNMALALGPQAKAAGCHVDTSDGGVDVGDGGVRFPDVMVSCDPHPDNDKCELPALVIEVLSPSTALIDTTVKLRQYQALEHVRTIAIVDPQRVAVVTYTRTGDGWDMRGLFSLEDAVQVDQPPLALKLADIYDQLDPLPAHPGIPDEPDRN